MAAAFLPVVFVFFAVDVYFLVVPVAAVEAVGAAGFDAVVFGLAAVVVALAFNGFLAVVDFFVVVAFLAVVDFALAATGFFAAGLAFCQSTA